MAQYVFDLSKDRDVKELLDSIDSIEEAFTSRKFKEFLADKCLKALYKIQQESLSGAFLEDENVQHYRTNHKTEINDDSVVIYNDTTLSQSEMYWVSPETRLNYPDGISIAYIVEFGTGIKGTSQDDWQVDVKGYGSNGWWYYNVNVNAPVWTNGIEGRFIYQKPLETIERDIVKWTNEYYEKEVE